MTSSRNDAPDTLLDLMIAVEALLSKEGEKVEIAYRIALRGAYATNGTTPQERATTRKMLATAYNLRSEVVHGAKREPEISATTLNDLQSFVATTIRLSAYGIAQGTPLVDQLELALLGDGSPLAASLARLS
jgi:hypothetical protein